MFLMNLAYPEWITIDCKKFFYMDIVCLTKDRGDSTTKGSGISLLHQCSERYEILKNNSCFNFVYFDGGIISERGSPKNFGSLVKLKTVKQFQFIILAVDNFPNLLHVDKGRIITISHIRYQNIINFYSYRFKLEETRGYLIKRTDTEQIMNITSFGNLFICQNREIVSRTSLCDGIFDCGINDTRDEEDCICKSLDESKFKKCKYIHSLNGNTCHTSFLFSGYQNAKCPYLHLLQKSEKLSKINYTFQCQDKKHISISFKDDLVPDCRQTAGDEFHLLNIYQKGNIYSCQQLGQIPCRRGHSKCFHISDICIYKLDIYNQLFPCRTGEHIQNCEEFECNKKYKCPGYYCIPFSYICNGKWDCPYGSDEYSDMCRRNRQCPNMFHCKQSQICIHTEDMCDYHSDCPLGDDEEYCSVSKLVCPDYCLCHNIALQCNNISGNQAMFLWARPYIGLWISNANITSLDFLKWFSNATYLYIDNNKLHFICGVLTDHQRIKILDLHANNISVLLTLCFFNISFVTSINLSKNKIYIIYQNAFFKLPNLKVLNLAKNILNNLEKSVLNYPISLNVDQNPFLMLEISTFRDAKVQTIETEDYHICCIVSAAVMCRAMKPWYVSCSKLLPNLSMRVLVIIVSTTILFLNLVSILFQFRLQIPMSFKLIILSVNISDVLCCCYLYILLIADYAYDNYFVTKEVQWRSSISCLIVFTVALMFTVMSALCLLFISFFRTILVIFPLNVAIRNKYFIARTLGILFTMGSIISILIGLIYKKIYYSFPTSLCLPFIDPTHSVKLLQAVTVFVTTFQIISSLFICANYVILLTKLKSSQRQQEKSSKKSLKSVISQLVVVTVSNLLCWLPSDIIYLSSLFISEYSIDLVIWTTIVVSPINSIINPIVFIVTSARISFKKSLHSYITSDLLCSQKD